MKKKRVAVHFQSWFYFNGI